MEDDGNSCVICYDPLSCHPVGTTIPCGHLFHQKCFETWQQRCRGRDTKCPMCNSVCTHPGFVRIFCNFEQPKGDDDDGVSLSSEEEDTEEEEASAFPYPVEEEEGQTDQQKSPVDDDDVIEILDDEEEKEKPRQQRAQVSSGGNTSSVDDSKYRKKAKALKQQVKRLERQRKELVEKEHTRSKQQRELQQKLEGFEKDIDLIERESNVNTRLLEEARYELSKATSERAKLKRNAEESSKSMLRAQNALAQLQACHQKQLDNARSNSMTEVRELKREHRELAGENQKFKLAIAKQTAELRESRRKVEQLQDSLGVQVSKSIEHVEVDRRKHQKEQAKALKKFQNARRLEDEQASARDEQKELKARLLSTGKYSALSRRTFIASEKKLSKANSILDRIDVNSRVEKKRKVEPVKTSIQIKKTKSAHIRKAPPLKGKKKSHQNDIRSMFRSS